MTINGLRVIESRYLTEAGTPYEVRRSWRERLFSRPWRPLHATRTIVPQVPMKGGYRYGTDRILMHPETVRQLSFVVPPAREIVAEPSALSLLRK